MYNHRHVDYQVALDACLDLLGAVWKNYLYHLPIPYHYLDLGRVHLDMVNILVALKLFGPFWCGCKVLIQCDEQAVVSVLINGKTRDLFLAGLCEKHLAIYLDLLSYWKDTPDNKSAQLYPWPIMAAG